MLKPLRVEHSAALTLAGRNGRFEIGPSPGIKDLWEQFMQDFGRIEGQVGMKAYGVCHNFDGAGHMDYLAAAEVRDAGEVPGYLYTLNIPARRVAVFVHAGPLETISQTWNRIFTESLAAANLTVVPGPQFEVYPDDFGSESSSHPIEIHIPVS